MAVSNVSGKINVFTLAMINIIAVDSLRTLPFSAKFHGPLIFYYLIIGLTFFIPVALVTAEMATTWPKNGGIYNWVKEAFGPKYGFLVVWLQWIYNVVWYPTILSLVASIVSYLIDDSLRDNQIYTVCIVICIFWSCTFFNLFGMKVSGIVSTLSSLIGTLIPMFGIIIFGAYWYLSDLPLEFSLTLGNHLPKVSSLSDLALVTTIIFGLMGLEMSAVHADDVIEPEKNFPIALSVSSIVILFSLMLSSYVLAQVVPKEELNIVTGMLQAFEVFLIKIKMPFLIPVVAIAIIFGALGGIAAWIIGPTKGLLAAAKENNFPKFLQKTNKHNVPVNILLTQAIIVTILSFTYVSLPSVESAYLILTELTAILALLMYVLMFAAAIYLRYSHKDIKRPYKVPFGNIGMWVVAGLGFLSSSFAIILGFIPPSQVDVGDPTHYVVFLVLGTILFCSPGFLFTRKSN